MDIDISFVVPVYNKTITEFKECLKSFKVGNPDFSFDVVIVDDGSDANFSKEYKRITLSNNFTYIHKENGGVSSARNLGIRLAKGKYISFVDADDEIVIENIHKNDFMKKPDVVFYNVEKQIGKSKKKEFYKFNIASNNITENDILKYAFKEGLINWSVAKLFNTKYLREKKIIFNTQMKYSEDFDFVIRILSQHPLTLYYSRVIYKYKFSTVSSEEREKKYPLVVLQNLYRNFQIQEQLLKKTSYSKEKVDEIDKAIRQSIIKNVVRIYSHYLIANPEKAKMNIDRFSNIILNIQGKYQYYFITKFRINMITAKRYKMVKLYFYLKQIYHFIKGKN